MEPGNSSASGRVQQSSAANSSPRAIIDWNRLPMIVQDLIWEQLADKYGCDSPADRKNRAACAAVSMEWQEFFEGRSFNKLVLHPSALGAFEKIIQRRRIEDPARKTDRMRVKRRPKGPAGVAPRPPASRMPRIKHIWLRIELVRYDCKECKAPENYRDISRNNTIFTSALWKLLDILSTWEKIDKDHGQELALELSAHSPSDSKHMYQDQIGLQDDYPYLADSRVQREFTMRCFHDTTSKKNQLNDEFHGFRNGEQIPPAPHQQQWQLANVMRNRLIRPLDFDFFGIRFRRGRSKTRLPEVRMVTSFLIRRQYYRELCPSAFGRLLAESLVGLRHVRHERWRAPHFLGQDLYKMSYGPTEEGHPSGLGTVLGSDLPSTLESLHIFEDFSDAICGKAYNDISLVSGVQVLRGLASTAPNLKHLSVSFLSDAMYCFKHSDGIFPNLESIVLTSQSHLQDDDRTLVNELLLEAAITAMRMPKLQIMELWNCEDGHADIIRYESTGNAESSACRLTWRSSWCSNRSMVSKGVARAWKKVASTNASRELILEMDPLPQRPYADYGAVIHHLKLRDSVLHPISAMQVRVGTGEEEQPEVPAWKSGPQNPFRNMHV